MTLTGKTALVTGGSSGIEEATAHKLTHATEAPGYFPDNLSMH